MQFGQGEFELKGSGAQLQSGWPHGPATFGSSPFGSNPTTSREKSVAAETSRTAKRRSRFKR
jgi:hypothetical protein